MSDSTDPADRSPARMRGERPINLILPVVTAIVGFVIGFLLSDISRALSSNPELPTPTNVSGIPADSPRERETHPDLPETPDDAMPDDEDDEDPGDDGAPS